MLSRILFLEPGQLRRAGPFFGLYLILFAALTLADGLSLALFVQRAGADQLPKYQAIAAVFVLLGIGLYMKVGDRFHGAATFQVILAVPLVLFAGVWLMVGLWGGDDRWLGALFIGREFAFALVVLHFGTWLLEFFTRAELNRVTPFIYSGGRVGGILGGLMLERLSQHVAPVHLLVALCGLLGLCAVGAWVLHRKAPRVADDESTAMAGDPAPTSMLGFLKFVGSSRLMFWITVTSICFFACRTALCFQYSAFFETHFASDVEMAMFLGRYTQYALFLSLIVQLLLVNRLVAWAGLRGAHMTYAVLLAGTSAATLGAMTLTVAVASRLVENELRFCLRNPVAQMIVNQFPKATRLLARAWSLGLLIPLSTLAASSFLAYLLSRGWESWTPYLTTFLGVGYFLASLGLVRSLLSPPSPTPLLKPVSPAVLSASEPCGPRPHRVPRLEKSSQP